MRLTLPVVLMASCIASALFAQGRPEKAAPEQVLHLRIRGLQLGDPPPAWAGIVASRQWVRCRVERDWGGKWRLPEIYVHFHVIAGAKWSRTDGKVGLAKAYFVEQSLDVRATRAVDSSTGQYFWLASEVRELAKLQGHDPERVAREKFGEDAQRGSIEDLVGRWEGTNVAVSPGGGLRAFRMAFALSEPDEEGARAFEITYGGGDAKKSVRKYRLEATDRPDRFVLDERNGVRIDAWFLHRTLWTRFRVGTSDLVVSYRVEGRRMLVQFVTTTQEPSMRSGGEGKVPEVASFGLRSVQRAVLYPSGR